MSAIYSAVTCTLYLGQCVMWPVWQPVVESFVSTMRNCIAVTERIWWAGKDIHSTKALKSFLGRMQIPSHSTTALSGSSGRFSGRACRAPRAMAGIFLSEYVGREPVWKQLKGWCQLEETLTVLYLKRNMKFIDKLALAFSFGCSYLNSKPITKRRENPDFRYFIDENIFNLLTQWTHNII